MAGEETDRQAGRQEKRAGGDRCHRYLSAPETSNILTIVKEIEREREEGERGGRERERRERKRENFSSGIPHLGITTPQKGQQAKT